MSDGLKVQPEAGMIILSGKTLVEKGPSGGLEVMANLVGGKNHESVMLLDAKDPLAIRTAFVGFLGLQRDGQPAQQDSGLPARGWPISITARWQPDAQLEPDTWVETPLSSLVRNRLTNSVYPSPALHLHRQPLHPKRHRRDPRPQPNQITHRQLRRSRRPHRQPLPHGHARLRLRNQQRHGPLADSTIEYIFERAELPLTITQSANGALFHDGAELSDEALGALLKSALQH